MYSYEASSMTLTHLARLYNELSTSVQHSPCFMPTRATEEFLASLTGLYTKHRLANLPTYTLYTKLNLAKRSSLSSSLQYIYISIYAEHSEAI